MSANSGAQAAYSDEANKTFVVFQGDNVYGAVFHHETETWDYHGVVAEAILNEDSDLDMSPALCVGPDGHIHVFYVDYADKFRREYSTIRYRQSAQPYSMEAMEDESRPIVLDYLDAVRVANPYPVVFDDMLYLYFHWNEPGEGEVIAHTQSPDGGQGWSPILHDIDFTDYNQPHSLVLQDIVEDTLNVSGHGAGILFSHIDPIGPYTEASYYVEVDLDGETLFDPSGSKEYFAPFSHFYENKGEFKVLDELKRTPVAGFTYADAPHVLYTERESELNHTTLTEDGWTDGETVARHGVDSVSVVSEEDTVTATAVTPTQQAQIIELDYDGASWSSRIRDESLGAAQSQYVTGSVKNPHDDIKHIIAETSDSPTNAPVYALGDGGFVPRETGALRSYWPGTQAAGFGEVTDVSRFNNDGKTTGEATSTPHAKLGVALAFDVPRAQAAIPRGPYGATPLPLTVAGWMNPQAERERYIWTDDVSSREQGISLCSTASGELQVVIGNEDESITTHGVDVTPGQWQFFGVSISGDVRDDPAENTVTVVCGDDGSAAVPTDGSVSSVRYAGETGAIGRSIDDRATIVGEQNPLHVSDCRVYDAALGVEHLNVLRTALTT